MLKDITGTSTVQIKHFSIPSQMLYHEATAQTQREVYSFNTTKTYSIF